ncbi:TAXI family TRAP transporter solute-binding subunit [Sulfurospirillum barnesii]|uniref:TRAP transporter solute receptor, TAXI family n=1 Tax=Sulfurospirillum barnesii (strain ATCC 700032 / DSM 10660 / SES-3) TaxID=760154 RepID=I3XUP5_SULBS|nr:TAXI family TRAP transporter solute-binding subunit [Sulfurospirillum barnesii]AFL67669.1 TRAP transporter solute receptor, TAXI family [Sulfurospirillum barnesii SES-3]
MKRQLALLTLAGALSVPMFAAEFITIGTGGVTGTYYPTGGAICQMVNKNKKSTNIRCSVESTGGSVYNVNTIKAGELDFGIAQSDTVYQAFKGEEKFKDSPVPELRSAIAIYPELLALVVSKKSGIEKITDVKGKKINMDSPGSGTAMTADVVFNAFGIKRSDLALTNELKSSEGPTMLQDNHIDGYFFVAGHPTANIKDAANSLDINIVPIEGTQIDALVAKYPYYAKGTISGSFYKGVPNDVPSIGVKAVLVTSTKVKDDVVYHVVKTILDNFDKFKELHPAYKTITKESLLEGLSVPQHPGAIKAFKEAGLL